MKIGLVCPYNYFKAGGVQEVVSELNSRLTTAGHDVRVITPRPIGYKDTPPKGVIFIGVSGDVNFPFMHTTSQGSATNDLELVNKILKEEKFDLLHFHEPWVPFMSRQLLARSTSVNVATFHAKLPDNMMSKTIGKTLAPYAKTSLKYIDFITAVSEPASEFVKGMTSREISIIPNGINLEHYQIKSSKKKTKNHTILYIGRLEKRKGVKYLIRAFAKLSKDRPDVKLLIAGDGPEKAKFVELVNKLGISQKVEFLGYVSETEKLELLTSATVFCSPAIYGESFGIVLLEAIACGIPTVAGNNPGYTSVLKGIGSTGLVDPNLTTDFAKRLDLFLSDEELRKAWSKWANAYISQFDYKIVVSQYLGAYKRAIDNKA